jgi:MFS family permease
MVAALGITECASYGILSYAFAVFLAPMEAELGWSRTQLTGAFSLSWLVAGMAAIPIGRWVDRRGARVAMTAGSIGATALLLAWSRVERISSFYAIWIGVGVASAAVLYEPAFAVVATWFHRHRGRALTLLTFLGGLASVIFVPLASWLVHSQGWRAALVWLAAILGGVSIPLHALVLRRRPADLGLRPDGEALFAALPETQPTQSSRGIALGDAIQSRSFVLLSTAFGLSTLASTAMTVHLVPLLLERGYPPPLAAAAMGTLGLMALPGRLVFTPLGGRLPRAAVTATIFGLQALSAVVLLASGSAAAVWSFVVLFGAGFGAITPARAALVAETYGPHAYASISGVMALVLALARAAAPVGASLVRSSTGSYAAVLVLVLATSVVSGALALAAAASAPTREVAELAT